MTLVGSNQGNYFENPTTCTKHTLKARVATQLIVTMTVPGYEQSQNGGLQSGKQG